MSKADKMFKDLGYVRDDYTNGFAYSLYEHGVTIVFLRNKMVKLNSHTNLLSVNVLEAIQEKLKELGWL